MENGKLKMEPYAEMKIEASMKDGMLGVKLETCGNGAGYIHCLRKIVGDVARAIVQHDPRERRAFETHLLLALTRDSMEWEVKNGRDEN